VWLASRWSPASVALVGTLLPLIKHRLKVFIVFAGSGLQWGRSQPAAGGASSLVKAGLLGWMSW
jgi:hypothetical protein